MSEFKPASFEYDPMRGVRIERRRDGAIAYELIPGEVEPQFEVPLGHGRVVDIEVPPNPPIRVMDGRDFPQLDVPIVLVQPDVVKRDWRRGWCPVGGTHYDSELELNEPEANLVFQEVDGIVCIWADGPQNMRIERTGTFPLYLVVRRAADLVE